VLRVFGFTYVFSQGEIMKKIYDISLPVCEDTVIYPGDPPVTVRRVSDINKSDLINISEITLSTHTATHIDAPKHLFSHAQGIDRIPLEVLIGPVTVYEFLKLRRIEVSHLQNLPLKAGDRVLFKTDNSFLPRDKFCPDYTCLSPEAAGYIAEVGLILVGIDYFSVDPFVGSDENYAVDSLAVHKTLLSKGIIILEGIDLSQIKPACYELICLPLNLVNADGSPVRAILRDL
jgi:arylformamidase